MLARLPWAHSPCVSMVSMRAHCVCSVSMRISVFALGVPCPQSPCPHHRASSPYSRSFPARPLCIRATYIRALFMLERLPCTHLSMLALFTCAQSYCTHFHTVRHCPVPSHQFSVTSRNHNLLLGTSGPLSWEENRRKWQFDHKTNRSKIITYFHLHPWWETAAHARLTVLFRFSTGYLRRKRHVVFIFALTAAITSTVAIGQTLCKYRFFFLVSFNDNEMSP